MSRIPITVIFLTLNEEFHIGEAIDHVRDFAEDIFVVDSLSSDNTVSIALEKGAKVVQRPFTDFGDQWNFALTRLPIRTPWTMKLDPDERLTDALKEEIGRELNNPDSSAGYSFDRILYFMGRPMSHCVGNVVRIWRTGRCRFSDVAVNEHPLIDGTIKHLKARLLHFDSPDLHIWLEKQNRYTSMEARMKYRGEALAVKPNLFGGRLERIMFFKRIFYRLPCRYWLWGLYNFFWRGAWRAGRIGWDWTLMRIFVMRITELKWREMRISGREVTIPKPMDIHSYDPRILRSELQAAVNPESIKPLSGDKKYVQG